MANTLVVKNSTAVVVVLVVAVVALLRSEEIAPAPPAVVVVVVVVVNAVPKAAAAAPAAAPAVGGGLGTMFESTVKPALRASSRTSSNCCRVARMTISLSATNVLACLRVMYLFLLLMCLLVLVFRVVVVFAFGFVLGVVVVAIIIFLLFSLSSSVFDDCIGFFAMVLSAANQTKPTFVCVRCTEGRKLTTRTTNNQPPVEVSRVSQMSRRLVAEMFFCVLARAIMDFGAVLRNL